MKKKPNKYKVNIEETLSREIEVEADNELEALEIVLEKYRNQEIVLDESDFIGSPDIEIVK